MATSPFFSGRIPQDLFDHIEQRIRESGETKTEILVQALATYTGFSLPNVKEGAQSGLLERVEILSFEIEAIKSKIKSLESFQTQQALSKIEEIGIQSKEKKQEISSNYQLQETPLFPHIDNSDNKDDNKRTTNVKILNTKQATKFLGIQSYATIPAWNRSGQLPKVIDGKKIEFDHKENQQGYFWKITILEPLDSRF